LLVHPGKTSSKMINRYQLLLEQNWRILLTWGIIAGLILSSMLVTPFIAMGSLPLLLLVLLYLGILGIIILIRFPNLAFPLLVLASLIIPVRLSTGTYSSINISMLLVILFGGLWVVDMVIRQRKIHLLPSRTILPALLFCVAALLSFGFGQLAWFQAQGAPVFTQLAQLALFLLSVAGFLIVAHRLEDIKGLEWMVWLFIILGGIFIAARTLPWLSRSFIPFTRFTIPLFQRAVWDSLFWTWLMVLTFSQILFNKQLAHHWRLALVALLAATLYISAVVAVDWTSGWLPGLAAIGITLWIGAPQFRRKLVLLILAVGLFKYQSILGIIMVGDNEYSMMTRLEAWRIMGEVIKVNPLFGLGPANYYWFSALFPILGYYVPFNSHNNYVDILAQTGLIGLFCFIWFSVEVGRVGLKLRSVVPEGFPRAYVYGCIGGLGGMLVAGMLGDWVIPFVYNVGLDGFRASILGWMFLGALVAMENIYRKVDESEDILSHVE
jgi:hypothetical protein